MTARMTDEEFARRIDKQQKESGWRGAYAAAVDEADRARASEDEKDAAIKALVADNAALLEAVRRYDAHMDLSEPWSNGDLGIEDASGLNEASAELLRAVKHPHPGTALLERLQRLTGLLALVGASETDEHGNPLVSKHLIPEIWEALKDG